MSGVCTVRLHDSPISGSQMAAAAGKESFIIDDDDKAAAGRSVRG
jgi:hypothetical protein